jgi:hypothetical protein
MKSLLFEELTRLFPYMQLRSLEQLYARPFEPRMILSYFKGWEFYEPYSRYIDSSEERNVIWFEEHTYCINGKRLRMPSTSASSSKTAAPSTSNCSGTKPPASSGAAPLPITWWRISWKGERSGAKAGPPTEHRANSLHQKSHPYRWLLFFSQPTHSHYPFF